MISNEAFRNRTKAAAVRILRLYQQLPRTGESRIIGNQLLRSATSVAANYRAACRGRSIAEWYSKLCICIEEADETIFWLELLSEGHIVAAHRLSDLLKEYDQIVAMLATARKSHKQ